MCIGRAEHLSEGTGYYMGGNDLTSTPCLHAPKLFPRCKILAEKCLKGVVVRRPKWLTEFRTLANQTSFGQGQIFDGNERARGTLDM